MAPKAPDAVDQGAQRADDSRRAALEAPRRTDARQLPHQEPDVKAAHLHEQTFQDVRMPPHVHTAHPAGLRAMRGGTFQ